METQKIIKKIAKSLIVSVQAAKGEPLYNEIAMSMLIDTVIQLGKIHAVRLAGARDIKYTKNKYKDDVIIIGITKPDIIPNNYKELVYITPTKKDALSVIEAGADIVAFDGTNRKRPNNETTDEIIGLIHSHKKLAMADIATFEEAQYCKNKGADIISTTLSGYTTETQNKPLVPDFELLKKLKILNCPVILEGKIRDENDVKEAFEYGAHSVVIGSMITRPHKIIEKFKKGIKNDSNTRD